jgi:iron complex outermembrane receptor protein
MTAGCASRRKPPTATRPTAPAPTSAIRPSRAGKVNQRFGDPETKPRAVPQQPVPRQRRYRLVRLRQLWPARHLGRRHLAHCLQRHGAAYPIHPEGFLPLENSNLTDTSLVTGLRGEASGWRWDVSLNYGSNEFKLDLDNTSTFDQTLARPAPPTSTPAS